MAITTYSELQTAIGDWLDDSGLSTNAPTFIALAEAYFNRVINTDRTITALSTGSPTNWLLTSHPDLYLYASLAQAEFRGWNDERLPMIKGLVDQLLADVNTAELRRRRATAAQITTYATLQDAVKLNLKDDSLAAGVTTYIQLADRYLARVINTDQTLTALSGSNTSNWLLASHADLYLYASLIHAEAYGWQDERLPLLKQLVEGLVEQVNTKELRRRRSSSTAITSYTTLKTEIANYLQDESISAGSPLFIALAEAQFGREINTDQTWTALSGSNATNWILTSHPDLYLYASLIHAEGWGWQDDRLPMLKEAVGEMIKAVNIAEHRRRLATATTVTSFTTLKTAIENWLQDESLKASIPLFIQMAEALFTKQINTDQTWTALSGSNASNWILASHADLYLYASLIHAEAFGWQDDRIPALKALVDDLLDGVNLAELRRRRADQVAITTYATLKDVVLDNLADASLSASVPTYVAMGEAELNRRLTSPLRELTATASTVAGTQAVALPTGFNEARTILVNDDYALAPVSLNVMSQYTIDSATGEPKVYAISSQSILLGPIPDAVYTLTLTYMANMTPLSNSNTTNWLLTSHPDAYFQATMMQAELARGNQAQAQAWDAALAKTIAEINRQGNRYRSAAPVRLRSSVVV